MNFFRHTKTKYKTDNRPGFTLIEVITVLLVVSLGMVGVLSLITQNIQSQSLNKDTLIAYQLAQEGIEMIRGVRDTNWRNGRSWRTNLASGDYYMDYLDFTPHPAVVRADGNLNQDSLGFYYNASSNPSLPLPANYFSRIISLTDASDGGLVVRANIYWTDHGRDYVYSLETLLYDWY